MSGFELDHGHMVKRVMGDFPIIFSTQKILKQERMTLPIWNW